MATNQESYSENKESFVQPGREFALNEIADELAGRLDVPPDPVASGGYADIYLGTWTNLQAEKIQVAVKQFKRPILRGKRPSREEIERRRETRIKREVFVWSQTQHPNLHPLLGYISRPHPSIISIWCQHGNLWDYMVENQNLPRLKKVQLIHQVACGLNHLHVQTPPICHGDIKPENVLINDNLDAALSDFGLGRVVTGLSLSSGLTTSTTVHGTINYMAGELLDEEISRSNCETDVYAFGGLILAVMSEKPPFAGVPKSRIIVLVIQGYQPRPENHKKLPPSDPFWNLMGHCWNRIPADRPAMNDIVKELTSSSISKEAEKLPKVSETADELAGDPELPENPQLSTIVP